MCDGQGARGGVRRGLEGRGPPDAELLLLPRSARCTLIFPSSIAHTHRPRSNCDAMRGPGSSPAPPLPEGQQDSAQGSGWRETPRGRQGSNTREAGGGSYLSEQIEQTELSLSHLHVSSFPRTSQIWVSEPSSLQALCGVPVQWNWIP